MVGAPGPATVAGSAHGPAAVLRRRRELSRALAFEHAVARRSATSVLPSAGGFAVLHQEFPLSHQHNRLLVTGPVAVDRVFADAERILGGAGLAHRRIDVDDDPQGAALGGGRLPLGYQHGVELWMALTGGPDREPTVPVARVRYPAVAPTVARDWLRELPGLGEEALRQLVERQRATARACVVTHHVVRRGGAVVARCDLYRRGVTAQVENVATEPEWRGRGFARAVVLDAARAAAARGCTLVFLIADAADWPQQLYRRCGFQDLGRTHTFTATASVPPP